MSFLRRRAKGRWGVLLTKGVLVPDDPCLTVNDTNLVGPLRSLVSKPAPANITCSSFENAHFAKFGCDLAGPVGCCYRTGPKRSLQPQGLSTEY